MLSRKKKAALIVLLVLVTARKLHANPAVDAAIDFAAKQEKVPALLLKAICAAESNLDPLALNRADAGLGNSAFGLCQVLFSTARELTVTTLPGCLVDNPEPAYCPLLRPRFNAIIAARYLKKQLTRYHGSYISAIAAYNAGSVRMCPKDGWVKNKGKRQYRCIPGGLLNQRYVDRVLEELATQRKGK